MTSRRAWRAAAVLALATIAAYIAVWAEVSPMEVGRSDFTSTYVGATLLREGDRAHLYDESAQSRLHAQLIAPDTEGNLPFVDAPLAAALAAPVTLLPLDTAYRLWGLLQLALLVAAVAVAVRAAPWPEGTGRTVRVATAALALAGAGTLVGLLQAQWGGVGALGLALAYREWRLGNQARGAAVLVAAAAVAKPHLALGLAAFMLGWGRRRVILGALAAAGAAAGASLAVAGAGSIAQFFAFAVQSNTRWVLSTFVSFVGIPGSFLGNAGAAQVLGAAGSLAALGVALYLGRLVRRDVSRLDSALAGAAILSVLAAPHAGVHDLVLLAPPLAWSAAGALGADARTRTARHVAILAALWTALCLAAFVTAGGPGSFPGQLVPWVLLVAAAVSVHTARVTRSPAGHPVTSQPDAAAVGAMADGIRQRGGLRSGGMFSLPRRG